MKVPEYVTEILELLLQELYYILPLEAKPFEEGQEISEEKFSLDTDILIAQNACNFIHLLLNKILPQIRTSSNNASLLMKISSHISTLKKYTESLKGSLSGKYSYYALSILDYRMKILQKKFDEPANKEESKDISSLFNQFLWEPDFGFKEDSNGYKVYQELEEKVSNLKIKIENVNIPSLKATDLHLKQSLNEIEEDIRSLEKEQTDLNLFQKQIENLEQELARFGPFIKEIPIKLFHVEFPENEDGSSKNSIPLHEYEQAIRSLLKTKKEFIEAEKENIKKILEDMENKKTLEEKFQERLTDIRKNFQAIVEHNPEIYLAEDYKNISEMIFNLETISLSKNNVVFPYPEHSDLNSFLEVYNKFLIDALYPLKENLIQKLNQRFIQVLESQKVEEKVKAGIEILSQLDFSKVDEESLNDFEKIHREEDVKFNQLLNSQLIITSLKLEEKGQKLFFDFLKTEHYKTFLNFILPLLNKLEATKLVLDERRMALEMANGEKIKQMEEEKKQLEEKVKNYEKDLLEINQKATLLKEEHQKNHKEKYNKWIAFSEKISERVIQREAITEKLAAGLKFMPSHLCELQQMLESRVSFYGSIEDQHHHHKKSLEQNNENILNQVQKLKEQKAEFILLNDSIHLALNDKSKKFKESMDVVIQKVENFKFFDLDNTSKEIIEFLGKAKQSKTRYGVDKNRKRYEEKFKSISNKNEDQIIILEKNIKTNILELEKISANESLLKNLKELDEDLQSNIQEPLKVLENSLEILKQEQGKEIQGIYFSLSKYLPEHILLEIGQEEKIHADNLKIMKSNLSFMDLKLKFMDLKESLFNGKNTLNKIKEELEKVKIQNNTFKHENFSEAFVQQWEEYQQQQTENSENFSNSLKGLKDRLNTIDLLKIEDSISSFITEIQAASGMYTDHKDLKNLYLQYHSLKTNIDEISLLKESIIQNIQDKEKELEAQNTQFDQEKIKADSFIKNLQEINTLITHVENSQTNLNGKPTYDDDLLRSIVKGDKGSFVLDEDQFYETSEKKLESFQFALDSFQKILIQSLNTNLDLDQAFHKVFQEKINLATQRMDHLRNIYSTKKAEWDKFSEVNINIRHARIVLGSKESKGQDYSRYLLTGLQLSNREFENTHFEYVDFCNANLKGCTFKDVNFKSVIINSKTQLDIEVYKEILFQNIEDFHQSHNSLSGLMINIQKCCDQQIKGDWILEALERIARATKLTHMTHEAHLIEQKARAVTLVQTFIPHLDMAGILQLQDLVNTKHDEQENPYAFIRAERDWYRAAYGNTKTWETVMETIKQRLNELLKQEVLADEQKKTARKILSTQTKHTYGFGNICFFKPKVPEALNRTTHASTMPVEMIIQ